MPGNTFLHLTTKRAWEDALKVGTYSLSTKGKTLEEVGFIHGSFADQVEEASNRKSYPHAYGAIPCKLVDGVSTAHINPEGRLLQD